MRQLFSYDHVISLLNVTLLSSLQVVKFYALYNCRGERTLSKYSSIYISIQNLVSYTLC